MAVPPGYAAFNVRLKHATVSRPAYVTGGIQITGGANAAALSALGAIYCGAGSDFAELMDFDVTIGPVTMYVGQDGAPPLVLTGNTTRNGGVAITGLPSNCAVLVHKRSSRGGRRGRGRFFIPWTVGEGNVDEAGTITPATVTQLQGEMTDLLADHVASSIPMVILHEPSEPGTAHPTAPGTPDVVNTLVVDPLISTQRRRLGRR